MTGSYSWTEFSLNPASEGKGAAAQPGPPVTSVGSAREIPGNKILKDGARPQDSRLTPYSLVPEGTGGGPQFCPHSSRCNSGYILMRKELSL